MLTKREWTRLGFCQSGEQGHNGEIVYIPFVARVHALVDLVNQSERRAGQTLQGHEVEDCRDGTLATGLPVVVEDGERFGFTERHG